MLDVDGFAGDIFQVVRAYWVLLTGCIDCEAFEAVIVFDALLYLVDKPINSEARTALNLFEVDLVSRPEDVLLPLQSRQLAIRPDKLTATRATCFDDLII